jgi:serpin B
MTAAGGRGPTAGEVWTGLGLAGREDRAAAIVAATLRGLAGEELAVAQRLFVASNLSLEPSFVALTGERYGAPVERLDFAAADAAIARINGWTSEATRTRIPVIVPPGGVNGSTRLVLVNALYFLANWQTSFDPARTTDDSFVAPAGAVPCRMMHRRGPALLGEAAGASVLRLPYAGERFVATFVLPAEGTTLASLEATMTGETIGAWLAAPAPVREVELELPRFRVEAAAPMELRAPLTRLGMGTMFGDADFSGIAAEPLRVSSVFHRVFIETTEEGTEAAAATAVAVARGAALSTPRFRADRPFLFFVTDARGVVLFLARVAVPG